MTKRTNSILALAASAIFGGGILLAVEPNSGAAGQNQPAGQSPSGQQGQAAQQSGQASEQAGQQADQQILQELQKIAQDPQSAPDKLFLLNSAIDSMTEVELSQQAQQKAQNDQVKQLAQHLIQDHQQMNQKLQQTAQQLGVQIPQSLPRMKQEEIRIKSSLSAREFEQHYVAGMNASHAKDVACFEAASALSQNPQVKQFATESLPKLREHRQMARQSAMALGIRLHDSDEAVPAGAHLHGDASDANPATPQRGAGADDPARTGTGTGSETSGQRSSSGSSGSSTGSSGSGTGSSGSGTGSSGSGTGSSGSGTGSSGSGTGSSGTGTGSSGSGSGSSGTGTSGNTGK